jgi:pulcherriminic acid synthase
MVDAITAGDLRSDDYRRDPFPYWHRLRHEQPLFYDEVDQVWAVTRYDDVAAVFRDWATYSTKPYRQIFGPVIGTTLVEMDGPEHTTRRAILARPFGGKNLESYVGLIEQTVDSLSGRLPQGGTADVIGDYLTHIPVRIMAMILGLPEADHPFFLETALSIMAALEGVEPALSRGIASHHELGAYIDPLISARLAEPGTDVISRVVDGEVDGNRLDRDEIKTFISLLVNAGGQTTADGMAALWWDLVQHQDVLVAAREDEDLLDRAFSEAMRRDGPVVYEDRLTTQDVEWYGQLIPSGSIVRAFIASANNDDAVFADPLSFDPDRTDLRMGLEKRQGVRTETEAGHLTFGLGRHFCIGWHLSRHEAVIGARPLLHKLTNVRFTGGEVPVPTVDFLVRRLDRLDLDFEAA